MKFLFELLFLAVLLQNAVLISKKNYHFLVASLVFYLMFSDYILLRSGYDLGELSFAKIYVELVFVEVFILSLIRNQGKFFDQKRFIFLLLLSLLLLVVGATGNGVVPAVSAWRNLFLYILISEMIVYDSKEKLPLNTFISALVFFTFANGVAAILQYVNYGGNIENTWRYELIQASWEHSNIKHHERFMNYQIEREGDLRASGYMSSALLFGFVAAFAVVMSFFKLHQAKTLALKAMWLAVGATLLVSVYVSQVRTAFFIVAFSIMYSKFSGSIKSKERLGVIVFLMAPVVVIMGGYLFSAYMDQSVQGRVVQYNELFSGFSIFGDGLGANVGRFDSFYIYAIRDVGIFALAPILYLLYLVKNIEYPMAFPSTSSRKIFYTMVASVLTISSVMAVQHVAGSLFYFAVVFMLCSLNTQSYSLRTG